MNYPTIKRGLDAAAAAGLLAATSPVIAVTAAVVAVKLGRPVIFAQQRPGLDGEVFTLYKFRTMLPEDPEKGLVSDADRLTPFGRLLRATSLDELPSLWNVLKGDMSFVGPRPLRVQYLTRYTPEQARRHEVRPGITGLAQVSGRNGLAWEDRFELDVQYVDEQSFANDVRILVRTVSAVLRRDGISAEGEATMAEFWGTEEPRPA